MIVANFMDLDGVLILVMMIIKFVWGLFHLFGKVLPISFTQVLLNIIQNKGVLFCYSAILFCKGFCHDKGRPKN